MQSTLRLTTHNNDVIMSAVASQITSLTIVYSTVYSGADQRKHQSFASLAFVRGIHRWPVNSPHKWPVMRKMFPFVDVIMYGLLLAYGLAQSVPVWPSWRVKSHNINTLRPRQNGHHFAYDIFKRIFLNENYLIFLFEFYLNIFPGAQLSICHHWFRWWLGADQATNHYLNQWWPSLLTHICVTRPQWRELSAMTVMIHTCR